MTFFGWMKPIARALPQGEVTRRDVKAMSQGRYAECIRLLTEPPTEEDRDKAEQLRQAWLASRAMGC